MNEYIKLYKKYGFDYAIILQPYIIEYIMAGHSYLVSHEGYSLYSGKLFFIGAENDVKERTEKLKKELPGGWLMQHPFKFSKGKIVAYGKLERIKGEKKIEITGLGWIENPIRIYLLKSGSILDVVHWQKNEFV